MYHCNFHQRRLTTVISDILITISGWLQENTAVCLQPGRNCHPHRGVHCLGVNVWQWRRPHSPGHVSLRRRRLWRRIFVCCARSSCDLGPSQVRSQLPTLSCMSHQQQHSALRLLPQTELYIFSLHLCLVSPLTDSCTLYLHTVHSVKTIVWREKRCIDWKSHQPATFI